MIHITEMILPLLLVAVVPVVRSHEPTKTFTFAGDVRHFAVASNSVYVATEEKIYHLTHELTQVRSLTQRGVLIDPGNAQYEFYRSDAGWNATFDVNVFLPFEENDTLVSCGAIDVECGYCEVLNLADISQVVHRESILVGPLKSTTGSISFLVNLEEKPGGTFILAADDDQNRKEEGKCRSDAPLIGLFSTLDSQPGSIFSHKDDVQGALIKLCKTAKSVEFVDGFQIDSVIYLLSNVNLKGSSNSSRVRLLWLEDKGMKKATLGSLRGRTLGMESRLLAGSVIPGGMLWCGVFGGGRGDADTELVVFDLTPDLTGQEDADPDFCNTRPDKNDLTSKLLNKIKVLYRQQYMTSVLAVTHKSWMVFFIVTADGQLIKLTVDKNFHTSCPRVLYRADEDRTFFPKLLLDPVDKKHIYLTFQNQMMRVPVSKCGTYTNELQCWKAQDPYCVWCGSESRCMFEENCQGSDWISIPDGLQDKMISHKLENTTTQITFNIQVHVSAGQEAQSNFKCGFSASPTELCSPDSPTPKFPQCTCILDNSKLPSDGLMVTVEISLGKTRLTERVKLLDCNSIKGPPTTALCRQCIEAGCGWATNVCVWANQGERNDTVCPGIDTGMNVSRPEITSITPSVVSFYGRNNAVLSGQNLDSVTRVRIQAEMDCDPKESPVMERNSSSLRFHIPSTENKGVVKVCVLLPDGSCHGNANITYRSLPTCTDITPNSTWLSGHRKITITGSELEFAEEIKHHYNNKDHYPISMNSSSQKIIYYSGSAEYSESLTQVFLGVGNETQPCSKTITYYPDPEFTTFSTLKNGDHVRITIQKKPDNLEMTPSELSVWGIQNEVRDPCIMDVTEVSNEFFVCDIQHASHASYQELEIQYGSTTITLTDSSSSLLLLMLLLIPFIIILVVITVAIVIRRKKHEFTDRIKEIVDKIESDTREQIRQGFVDLQMEGYELIENVGAIPFLDYKHFASKIFFPENEALMNSCIRDIGQDTVHLQLDECCQGLSRLIQDQLFLTSMVHALEEQKSFTIKDKCTMASLLTVTLHNNLWYLTEVMEVLLRALMQQNSNAQPKLLLRRTESIVEKLLTNWMSICLYGFLRETVGQHLFLLVSGLKQQTAKGPVDCVTEKALYTLSEDWLLWQAQDFKSLKLRVLFAVGTEGEVSEPLEVNALSCDTVEQVKDKILSTFKTKFGFAYKNCIRDISIEYEKEGSFIPLEEVDSSSEVIGEVTMLNTLKHYKVPDGATIKVLSREIHRPLQSQISVKDDENFSRKYFHLIDPDVDEIEHPERKKLKLKEVYLTKLFSTKVAVQSSVENLFRSIWGTQCRAPLAVKFFFDFLDAQAEGMKITDPDVLHIWKTNSLPLRFWINIMKNPQFVFDIEKTPNLDGCLNVIAQAFMDSFSLSDIQLGKHAPTNKLLYAKDIPKFKQEVRVYYKQIRDQSPVTTSEFKDFLQEESRKHENEFNEAVALREVYKFIKRYFTEITEKLDQNGAPTELKEQLHHVKNSFDALKSCSWN